MSLAHRLCLTNMGNTTSTSTTRGGGEVRAVSREEDLAWLEIPLSLYDEAFVDERSITLPETRIPPGPTSRVPETIGSHTRDSSIALVSSGLSSSVSNSNSDSSSSRASVPPVQGRQQSKDDDVLLALAELVEVDGPRAPMSAPIKIKGEEKKPGCGVPNVERCFKNDASNWDTVSQFPKLCIDDKESDFEVNLGKRMRIYSRIFRAFQREMAKGKVPKVERTAGASSSKVSIVEVTPEEETKIEPMKEAKRSPGSVMMAAAARLILELATEFQGKDSRVFQRVCETIMEILAESDHLPFADLESDAIEIESFRKILDFGKQLVEGQVVGSQEDTRCALSLLVSFAVSCGSIEQLIYAIDRLLSRDLESSQIDTTNLQTTLLPCTYSFLKQLVSKKVRSSLSFPGMEGVGFHIKEYQHREVDLCHLGMDAMVSDGNFLYVWTSTSELLKVGTGLNQTEPGKVYMSKSISSPEASIDKSASLQISLALYGLVTDIASFLYSVTHGHKPRDILPLVLKLFERTKQMGEKRMLVEYAVRGGSSRRVLLGPGKILWPPEDLHITDNPEQPSILFAYFGTFEDVTKILAGTFNGHAAHSCFLVDLNLPESDALSRYLHIHYSHAGNKDMTAFSEHEQILLPRNTGDLVIFVKPRASLTLIDDSKLILQLISEHGTATRTLITTSELSIDKLTIPDCRSNEDLEHDGSLRPVPPSELLVRCRREAESHKALNIINCDKPGMWVDPRGADGTGYIVIDFANGKKCQIEAYELFIPLTSSRSCDPSCWKVEGYEGFGRGWVLLHEVNNYRFDASGNSRFRLSRSKVGSYRAYRISFGAIRNAWDGAELQLAGIRLLECPIPALPTFRHPVTSYGPYVYELAFKNMDTLYVEKIDPEVGGAGRVLYSRELLDLSPEYLSQLKEEPKTVLQNTSIYTNGSELVIVAPQDSYEILSFLEKSKKEKESALLMTESYELETGRKLESSLLPKGFRSRTFTYDFWNNMIWSFCSSTGKLTRNKNTGLAPRLPRKQHEDVSTEVLLCRFPKELESCGAQDIAIFMLAQVDRISSHYAFQPLHHELGLVTEDDKAGKEPFSYELHVNAFDSLLGLIKKYLPFFSAPESDPPKSRNLYVLASSLRILGVHLYQLIRKGHSIALFGDSSKTQEALGILMQIINTRTHDVRRQLIIQEALEVLVTGVDVFYPTAEDQAKLLGDYLNLMSHGKFFKADAEILDMLLKRLRNLSSLSFMISASSIDTLISVLLNLSCIKTVQALHVCNPGSTQEAAVRDLNLMATLINIQKYVFANTAQDLVSGNEPRPDLSQFLNLLVEKSRAILRSALESCNASSVGCVALSEEVEAILLESLVGTLLTSSLGMLWCLLKMKSPPLEKTLLSFGTGLDELALDLSKINKLLASRQMVNTMKRSVSKTVNLTLESEHEYKNNLHEKIKLHVPYAKSIQVVFNSETATEQSYDYVKIFKDEDMTETWHPGSEKFSGNGNWPGKDLSPLVIHSDTAWILWHTDGSNVDWGWKLSATAEINYEATSQQHHWLMQLERVLALMGGQAAQVLLRGDESKEDLENMQADWFDDPILSTAPSMSLLEVYLPQLGVSVKKGTERRGPSRSLDVPPTNLIKGTESSNHVDSAQLLQELLKSPLGPKAQELVQLMKEHVIEDRGQLPIINQAVYAAAAALMLHNNLVGEAAALAANKFQSPSLTLVKTWRTAQKMRQWLQFSDAAAAQAIDEGPQEATKGHRRRPSLHSKTSESILGEVCEGAIDRAKWLLSIAPLDGGPNLMSQKSRHKSRGSSADLTASWSALSSQLAAVETNSAAHELKQLLEFRRALRERKRRKKTTTELVLEFLQSDTKVAELLHIIRIRNERATRRAKGFSLARNILETLRSDTSRKELLRAALRGIRATACAIKGSEGLKIHYMNGLSGAEVTKKQEVTRQFRAFLSASIQIIQETGSDTERLDLSKLALQACALDYEPEDDELLHNSRLLPQIHALAYDGNSSLQHTALSLFKLLLRRSMRVTNPSVPVASIFHHDILAALKWDLHSLVLPPDDADKDVGLRPSRDSEVEAKKIICSPKKIGRSFEGLVAPYFPLGTRHTISFWLYRHAVQHRASQTKSLYKVVGSEGCLVRRTPLLESEVVTTLEMGTILEVAEPEREYMDHPLIQNGRRLRIVRPVAGYGSRHASQGYQILRQEAEANEGDRVTRGPDWTRGAEDGGNGQLGTVVAITSYESAERRGIRVRWDHNPAEVFTYRWGYVGKYDVSITNKDESGVLLFKVTVLSNC